MQVCLIYSHRHGQDVSFYASQELATRSAVDIVMDYVDEVSEVDVQKQILTFIKEGAFDKAIEVYIQHSHEESLEFVNIAECTFDRTDNDLKARAVDLLTGLAENVRVERDGWSFEFEFIGEGKSGDYDSDDPEDEPLFRFYVQKKQEDTWEDVEDASYCTRLSITADESVLQRLASDSLDAIIKADRDNRSIKKLCERLSWMQADSTVAQLTEEAP